MVLHLTFTCDVGTDDASKLSMKENVFPDDFVLESITATRTTRSKLRSAVVLQGEPAEGYPVVAISETTLPCTNDISVPSRKDKGKATKKLTSSASNKARSPRPSSEGKGSKKKDAKCPCPFKEDGCEGRFHPTNHDARRHMEIHTFSWQKGLYCARYFPQCAYTAVQDGNFRTHILKHHQGNGSNMTICRAIFQQAGPNGKPWVCNHSCSGGSPLSHWRAVHGTTEPETFEGTWFGAVFCSIDEYYQYHGTTPPMNYRTGYPFRSHPVRYPKAVVDAKIAEYGGKCGWSTDRCDEWTEKEIGNLPMLYTRDGGEVEADESEETPVFYMNAEASTDSDGEIIDAGANPTRPALPTSPQDHAFASCPPSPPPAGCTGPWEEFPKECAHHDEFHRIWVLEGQMPENSYEPHCQTYSLHQKQNSIATPEGSNVAEQQPLAVAPAFAPVSWGMQQPSDASSTLTEFAWALEYFHQPATPHGTLQGCLVPPSTPSHIQSYYGLEAQSPSGDLSHYYSSAHPTYAPCPPVYSQYQSPPVVSSGWSSQHTSSAPTRQPSPVRSDDEQVAVEALLGLGSSKP